MADRDKEKDGYGVSSSRGADKGQGYGDDQGTRVGKPKESDREHTGPSTRPVKEGLEGSIHDSDESQSKGGTSGAGTEAKAEPVERTRQHVSGYGGAGGTPKTSSDQREPAEPTGKTPA